MLKLLQTSLHFAILLFTYFTSDKRAKRILKKEQKKAEDAVHSGDTDTVNGIIQSSLKCIAIFFIFATLAGCSHTVYVPVDRAVVRYELDGKSGWWLPDATLAEMINKLQEGNAQ